MRKYPNVVGCSCQLELQQSVTILQKQLQLLEQQNSNFRRIQQTLTMALKQQLTQVNCRQPLYQMGNTQTILFSKFQQSSSFQNLSYQQLYQIQREKTSILNKQIKSLQQRAETFSKCVQQKSQTKLNIEAQERLPCSEFDVSPPFTCKNQKLQGSVFDQLNLQSNKTKYSAKHENYLYSLSKTNRSQSCDKMDKFMRTLNIQNRYGQKDRNTQQKLNQSKTNRAQNRQLCILIANNTDNFIDIKLKQNKTQKIKKVQASKRSKRPINQNREIVLKIISSDLIRLRR